MEEIFRDGAKRAKAMAVEKYKAGDLAGAKEFAVRARTLNPKLPGLLRLNAVLDLKIGFQRKIGGEPDWYAVLSVEPTADVETIQRSYRRLFLNIAMDGDTSVGSIAEANKILVDSWKFLCDEKRRKLYDERRLHQLRLQDRRRAEEQERIRRANQVPSVTYVPVVLPPAQRQIDPPRIIFSPEYQSRRESQFPSLTCNLLAYSAPRTVAKPPRMVRQEDEQKAEVKERGGGSSKRKAPPLTNVIGHVNQLGRLSEYAGIRANERRRNNLKNSQDMVRRGLAAKAKGMINQLGLETYVFTATKRVKRQSKNTNDEPRLEVMNVPDADFYNFDDDRVEASFGENQVWAAYDDYDGMPRFYALVHRVISQEPLKLCVSWLNSKNNEEIGLMKWIDSGFRKTSGRFSLGRRSNREFLINSFSHRVQWTHRENNFVQIYPKKGDVWALYANWSPSWGSSTPEEVVNKYEMVEVIQDFDEGRGGVVAVAPLVKVPGFNTVFRRLPDHKTYPRKELFRFSHQVPSRLLTGQEGENAPEGCLELDPAAMSMELLNVFNKEEMKNSENVFKKPKEEVVETMNNAQVYKIKEEKKD